MRSWCHFNKENSIVPKFKDFIMPNDKILKSTLSFGYKKINLIDSLPLFSTSLKNIMETFTDLKKGETPLFKNIDDVIIKEKDIDYCLNDSIGLALALKERFKFGNQKMTLASDAKSI
ncbi:hypothetical protein [Bartonella raoultii]|uniref:Uncharacterized protein n=1 Tax=Bartonella raoultii TaxID=1457020 RepID=A0ABS7I8I5_9HYPH|nr:hypothetical protein [Bartonella raoultii]MBX4335933.1 hypothetical protein [Bartonella raoultii]